MEQQTPVTVEQTAAAVNKLHDATIKAFSEFGSASLEMAKQQQDCARTINQLIADRNTQLELIAQLTEKLAKLAAVQTSDHEIIQVLATMNGMPGNSC